MLNKCNYCLYKTKKCNLCISNDLYVEKYYYFLKGPLSQWAKFPMTEYISGLKFNCCEQYMMYKKATLFNDYNMAANILNTKNPKEQKAYGRQVSGYKQETWDNIKIDIVYTGNVLKFSQNEIACKALLATNDMTLVEVNPWDRIWGIGLTEEVARKMAPSDWPGINLLGKILTSIRDIL